MTANKTVLITGASGFIGRNLAKKYSKDGWNVIGVGRSDWSDGHRWGIREWVVSDLSVGGLQSIESVPSLVIHCAGGSSVVRSMDNPYKDFMDTVNGTVNILEYVRKFCPNAIFLYISSAAVYGSCDSGGVSEDFLPSPVSPYGSNKYCAELMVNSYARNYGLSAVIVRLFSIYGNTLRKQLLWDACNKLSSGCGEFFGTGKEIRDWLHIDDVVNLLQVCASHASTAVPVVNGGSGVGVSTEDVLGRLIKFLGVDIAAEFTGRVREGDPSILVANVATAKNYGWKPMVDFNDGLSDYVKWFASCEK